MGRRLDYKPRKRARKNKNLRRKAVTVVIVAVVVACCMFFPKQFGFLGRQFKGFFSDNFGKGMFFIPLFILGYAVRLFRNREINIIQAVSSVMLFVFGCSFLGMVSRINYGGRAGKFLADKVFGNTFGSTGGFLVVLAGLIAAVSILFKISLIDIARHAARRLAEDWEEWQKTRSLVRKIKVKQIPVRPGTAASGRRAGPEPEAETPARDTSPPNVRLPEQPPEPEPAEQKEEAKKEKPGKEKKPKKENGKKESSAGDAAEDTSPEPEVPYELPPLELLATTTQLGEKYRQEDFISRAALLEKTLSNFNVYIKVTDVTAGPVVTTFELTPEPGVKIQQITTLSNDIALALKSPKVRVVAPVPGKGTVAIEVANTRVNIVGLRDIISSMVYQKSESKLAIALGKTADGKPYVTDLIPMPHLLIAGATGSGKSVCIHSIITSILYKAKPDEVKLMLIDPKRLELPAYNGLPHLYDSRVPSGKVKVVTQPKMASASLKSLVHIMEERYEKFAKEAVRNIDGYNEKMEKEGRKKEFYIVVIIDELADLMLTMPKDVEESIQRLAQMARAVGIHLILATQRPSVDVITGVIKANLPVRIAFQVLSKVDSRVILDTMGAEDLIGRGDMLFLPAGAPKPVRLQGGYVSEKEVSEVVKFVTKQDFSPEYDDISVIRKDTPKQEDQKNLVYLKDALELVRERKRVSQDLLKARFGSSSKASDILSLLEVRGFISKPEGTNRWQIAFDKIDEYLANAGGGENS